jgi:hypothetical protein
MGRNVSVSSASLPNSLPDRPAGMIPIRRPFTKVFMDSTEGNAGTECAIWAHFTKFTRVNLNTLLTIDLFENRQAEDTTKWTSKMTDLSNSARHFVATKRR